VAPTRSSRSGLVNYLHGAYTPTVTSAVHRSCSGPAAQASGVDGVGMQLVLLRKSMEKLRSRVLEAGGHGLEGSGLAVLFHLVTEGPLRTSALAERLGLDPSTTSRHVAGLERTGHLERVPDPADGRAWLVQASAAGRVAFEDTRALRNALVAAALERWTAQEVDEFAAALVRFNDAVADALDDSTIARLASSPRKDRR
jgi:DNA-binding MarR family transcriptional regulator